MASTANDTRPADEIIVAYEALSTSWVDYQTEIHAAPMRDRAPNLLMSFNFFLSHERSSRFRFYKEKFDIAFGEDRKTIIKLKKLFDKFKWDMHGDICEADYDQIQIYSDSLMAAATFADAIFFPFQTSPYAFKVAKIRSGNAEGVDPLWIHNSLDSSPIAEVRCEFKLLEGLWDEAHFEARLMFCYCEALTDCFAVDVASDIYLGPQIDLLMSSIDPFASRNAIVLLGVTLAKRLFAIGLRTTGLAVTNRVEGYSSLYCGGYPYIIAEFKKLSSIANGTARATVRPSHVVQWENINRLKRIGKGDVTA